MTINLSLRDAADIRALAFAIYQQLTAADLTDIAQEVEAIRMRQQPPRDAVEYLCAVRDYAEGRKVDLVLEWAEVA